ncbi:Tat pathway signal protein [Streptomyces sp. NPDC088768]|uniref:Tat pathway signal protein n=1 Tax=Streptomyces sp. NPDC088768 TaxID=3365894 RepID=UPI0038032DA5
MTNTRNEILAGLLHESGWTQVELARAFVAVAREQNRTELYATGQAHISFWIRGGRPRGRAPHILAETLTRKLRRTVTVAELGYASAGPAPGTPLWGADPVAALTDLGGDAVDRRTFLKDSAFSGAALVVPVPRWWQDAPRALRTRPATGRQIGASEVSQIREFTDLFSAVDQKHGGGFGRAALRTHLHVEVTPLLRARAADSVRASLYAAAGEMAYLVGWMAFDAAAHGEAQRYFALAARLAAEAADGPLAGHILRAMAHQAADLGHPRAALDFAEASMDKDRHGRAAPRERALLSIVHARALAATGDRRGTLAAISRAEADLARDGGDGPARAEFFGPAALAHEAACALQDLGHLPDAQIQFERSVTLRAADTYRRTHSVTLGYLGALHIRQGRTDEAVARWSQALDTMNGVRSGRARQVVERMRVDLSPYRRRGPVAVRELDQRAAEMARTIG